MDMRAWGKDITYRLTGQADFTRDLDMHILNSTMATLEEFQKIDIRVGKIIEVEDFPEARRPSYKLRIDLGQEIGVKKSCAQLPKNYTIDDLKGKLVLCIVNFPPRQIGHAVSEVFTLGVPDGQDNCFLVVPDRDVPLGGRLY